MDKLEDHTQENIQKITDRVFELLGGEERAYRLAEAAVSEINTLWNQDTGTIGRILRAHLFLEHFMTNHIQKSNPKLPNLQAARLTFSQKIKMISAEDPLLKELLPGIKHFNKIRNRLAHKLDSSITKDDANVFKQALMFNAMREAGARPKVVSAEPLDVLEDFALYAGNIFNSHHDEHSLAYKKAYSEFFGK